MSIRCMSVLSVVSLTTGFAVLVGAQGQDAMVKYGVPKLLSGAQRLAEAKRLGGAQVRSTTVPLSVSPAAAKIPGKLDLALGNMRTFSTSNNAAAGYGQAETPPGFTYAYATVYVRAVVPNKPHLVTFYVRSLADHLGTDVPGQFRVDGHGVDQINNLTGNGSISCVVPANKIPSHGSFFINIVRKDKGYWAFYRAEVSALP